MYGLTNVQIRSVPTLLPCGEIGKSTPSLSFMERCLATNRPIVVFCESNHIGKTVKENT
jgi:hypothetical protein